MKEHFEKMYNQKFERLYEQRLAEGTEKIKDDLANNIFWNPRHKGFAFSYRMQTLKDEVKQYLLRQRKAEEEMYDQMLAEGREKISKEIESEIFFTPGTEGYVFAYRVKKLEEGLRSDLLSTES